MTLRPVDPSEIPGIARRKSKISTFVEEFRAGSDDVVSVEGTELQAKILARLMRSYIERRNYDINVIRRKDIVFLQKGE